MPHTDPSPSPPRFAVCRDGDVVPARLQGAVAAIGNFDGVHRGHQELIRLTLGTGRPAAVVTFEPHPRSYFQPDVPMFRLTPEPIKLAILERMGLAGVFVRTFNADFAALTAEQFVDLLAQDLGLSGVLIGYDFHFGRGRAGTPAIMAALCRERGLACHVAPAVTEGSEPVSSSAIRQALEAGRVASANAMLGYRWFVRAEVRHGEKRGRELGYPTANLKLPDDCGLRHGIYAVRTSVAGRHVDGVASFGRRPTFDNGAPLLEVHLFDYAGDLYGRELDVEFVGWIRGEEKFDGIEALIQRMDRDSEEARHMLAKDAVASMIG
ncbi:bifunctional riboflavin kinase/FAD synthetase [Microvirga antarctica]|uniref:bifunctional riboflavin kinase/FAD synthetase n=1 Tax=Microvirga antarctica TaxID=2819233 RepID=UPI001B309F40|nr:bifunctional riboflavin kinase/FAD synthetase [Microvirga antarctica]